MAADPTPSGPATVLVGYATAAGSTAGIAERIAGVLRESGLEVTCRPVGPDLDPAGFDALVIGSAVHNMAWLPPATRFLVPAAGTGAPVWVFSVGGLAPRGPVTRAMTSSEATRVEQDFPATLTPRAHRFFGGIVQMTGTPLWGRLFYRLTGSRPGDHRDWPAIEAWARELAEEIARLPPARPADRS